MREIKDIQKVAILLIQLQRRVAQGNITVRQIDMEIEYIIDELI